MLFATIALFLLFPALGTCASPRPNIILFITDDQSPMAWADEGQGKAAKAFGFCGEKGVHTPEIDRLARDGMVFNRAYVSSSVCSPSRYTTLTGRYAGRCEGPEFMRLHPPGNMTRVENNTELEPKRPNVAKLLQQAGYRTGFVGKSHVVRHDLLNSPERWKEFGLQPYPPNADPRDPAVSARMRHNHNEWRKRIREYGFDFADGVYAANLKELHNDAANVHNVEWTTAAALEFIESSKEKPFFLYYATTVPHGPAPWNQKGGKFFTGLDADPKITGAGFVDREYDFMPTRPAIQRGVRQAGKPRADSWLRWVDAGVGAMRKKLEELHLLENTLIIVTSDHGAWRHGKATLHEGGLRVPLLMHWPAGIRAGSTYDGLVQNIDFAPTFLDLAGMAATKLPPMDGVSLQPVLAGTSKPVHTHLFAELGYARGVLTTDWKYIAVRYDQDINQRIAAGKTFRGFQGEVLKAPYLTRNGHLGHHASANNPNYFSPDQLYHLADDPREERNLAAGEPDKLVEMKRLLTEALRKFPERPFAEFTGKESR